MTIQKLLIFSINFYAGMVIYPSWWILAKYRAKKPSIWCCSQHGSSSHRYVMLIYSLHDYAFSTLNPSFCSTGYSVVRSLSEAPKYASVIANILKGGHSWDILTLERSNKNLSAKGNQGSIFL